MKSILEICQEAADMAATQRPADLFSTSSLNDQIWLSVAKSELDSLMRYGDWQELTKIAVVYTSASQRVYPLSIIAPDFYSLLQNTVYVKDNADKVIGAITPERWAQDRCFNVGGDVKFKLQNGRLVFLNDPGEWSVHFTYRSANIVYDGTTGEEKTKLESNSDVPIFDEFVVKLGVLWRWLKRSGLDYSEEFNEYQRELKKRFGTELATQNIMLSGGQFADLGDTANVIVSQSGE